MYSSRTCVAKRQFFQQLSPVRVMYLYFQLNKYLIIGRKNLSTVYLDIAVYERRIIFVFAMLWPSKYAYIWAIPCQDERIYNFDMSMIFDFIAIQTVILNTPLLILQFRLQIRIVTWKSLVYKVLSKSEIFLSFMSHWWFYPCVPI